MLTKIYKYKYSVVYKSIYLKRKNNYQKMRNLLIEKIFEIYI